MNFYNENDPKAAHWLRNLIAAGLIPPGEVDETGILDLDYERLGRYTQCHFFAGIAGWSYALQLAGWPADRKVWTGSCPCQPFSVAGKGLAEKDERHLWPAFRDAIAICRPPTIFGEQVASKAGRVWLAGVRSDLEDLGYAVGAADLCAAGIGSPHIRQRLFWMADAEIELLDGGSRKAKGKIGEERHKPNGAGRLAYAEHDDRRPNEPGRGSQEGTADGRADAWSEFEIIHCRDGKSRRVGTGIPVLANGISNRVAKLRGIGNAIVPQLAAEFIAASEESIK